jgi:hypothetical protein
VANRSAIRIHASSCRLFRFHGELAVSICCSSLAATITAAIAASHAGSNFIYPLN